MLVKSVGPGAKLPEFILVLPFICCVTNSRILNLSVPQFLLL